MSSFSFGKAGGGSNIAIIHILTTHHQNRLCYSLGGLHQAGESFDNTCRFKRIESGFRLGLSTSSLARIPATAGAANAVPTIYCRSNGLFWGINIDAGPTIGK
ncbi:hypothetical protein TWF718_000243 [Orbilia javanica]|uniref:Uncharacterized protein n=1 Tax=Orbilia javanica TaxID=47235 RepID=A0AAN8NEQ9_9PEZI